jgi:uncharacterized protein (TIGR03089 family)
MTPSTVGAALRLLLSGDAAQPLVTYLGADGSRTELSVRTFENNVAKAANLLQDDATVTAESLVVLRLPLHWQLSVWLGACAAAGCVAWPDGDPDAAGVELAVLAPDQLEAGRAPITLASALHPFGLPFATPLPPGVSDAALEVRAHGDRFSAIDPPGTASPWLRLGTRTWTQGEALEAAVALADTLEVAPGGRLLCARPLDETSALAALALPLAVGGSVVLVDPTMAADSDALAAIADRERCTAMVT